jgi:uncharacterized protein with PQ loop repeat
MSTDALRVVFGVVMLVLAAFYSLPQWWRVRRTGAVEGVSLAATSNAFLSCVAWVLYGVVLRDPWVVLTCLAALPSLGATAYLLGRRDASRAGITTTWAWAAALIIAGIAYPWFPAPLTLLLGGSILWYVGPAVWLAWSSADISGIAAGAWWVLLADAGAWLAYSLLAGVPAGLLYAVIAGAGAGLMLVRIRWRGGPDCGVCPPLRSCTCAVTAS